MCRANVQGGDVERVDDDVVVTQLLQKQVKRLEVREDTESRPHNPIQLTPMLETERQWVPVLAEHTRHPGASGGPTKKLRSQKLRW